MMCPKHNRDLKIEVFAQFPRTGNVKISRDLVLAVRVPVRSSRFEPRRPSLEVSELRGRIVLS